MAQFLILVLRPAGYDHATSLDKGAYRDIDALNDEMEAAGIRVFVGGLRPLREAQTLHIQIDGSISLSGAFSASEMNYIDGLWILECENMDDALNWGRKASLACRASTEVRPFY
ncbi:MAG: hypothetical protein LR015_15820 [Verrucomicrobia bacterium]|nr:hypothetical protein [Verrucomicrobiota bacterium]